MAILQVSKHALERFVERTLGYIELNDIKSYLVNNEVLVQERITKLFESAQLVYTGKIKDFNACEIYVNKHGWVFPVDKKNNKIITVYKVELGLGEEFNKEYTSRMMESVLSLKEDFDASQYDILLEIETNKEEITAIEATINTYNVMIKNMQDEIKNIRERNLINNKKMTDKERALQLKLEQFICKKIF